jgi:hypothetical protein
LCKERRGKRKEEEERRAEEGEREGGEYIENVNAVGDVFGGEDVHLVLDVVVVRVEGSHVGEQLVDVTLCLVQLLFGLLKIIKFLFFYGERERERKRGEG